MTIAKLVLCALTALLMDDPTAAEPQAEQAQPQQQLKQVSKEQPSAEAKPAAPAAAEKDDELLAIEANIVSYTNAQRVRAGLPPMEVCPKLMESARGHCAWMARSRRMVHTSQPVAENIAMGQRSSNEAVRSWMASSGHRANILNAGHRRIGVAAYRASCGTIYWCQQFRR